MPMTPGDVVDGRFRLLRRVGAGGMGDVFRARDEESDIDVAVKVLRAAERVDRLRFAREARVLESISCPRIVRYLAHGETPAGALYLVMEWIEGEDLATRLARGPLPPEDALLITVGVAAALRAVHARGIVHRDIKPANVLLAHGPELDVRLVDFGIARSFSASTALTAKGALVGTPSYMAPEQITTGAIGAHTDMFALGCLLHECVVGAPPFQGANVMAVLAKILLADAPRIADAGRDVPDELQALVDALLAKSPDERLADADELQRRARRLAESRSVRPEQSARRAIGVDEQRVVSVVAATSAHTGAGMDSTLPSAPPHELATTANCELRTLSDGSLLCLFRGAVARDEATEAVRFALALARQRPELCVAVASGRASTGATVPTGDAIDRAVALISSAAAGVVLLDELTATLTEDRIELDRNEHGIRARSASRPPLDAAPLINGRRTSCVGRAKEIAFLRGLIEESASERVARAAIITAPAGLGKSRLCQELVRCAGAARLWLARGEGHGEAEPHAVAAQWVRASLDEPRGDSLLGGADALSPERRAFVRAFLGELLGLPPPPDDAHPWLRAARADAQLMSAHVRSALDLWMQTRLASPVVVLIDDAQRADYESVEAIERWLTQHRSSSFVAIAFARPEVRTRFPAMWHQHDVTEIKLGPLSSAACTLLVQQVLPDLGATHASEVVDAAHGHPLLLEEILRAHADGGPAAQHSLDALLEARLSRLSSRERRLMRVASVFDEPFTADLLAAVAEVESPDTATALAAAARDEIAVRRPERGDWEFRHALIRDVAYRMLTDVDRRAAHRNAARCIRARGAHDGGAVARHLQAGAETDEQHVAAADAWLDVAGRVRGRRGRDAVASARAEAACIRDSTVRRALDVRVLRRELRSYAFTDISRAVDIAEAWIAAVQSSPIELAVALANRAMLRATCGRMDDARADLARASALTPGEDAATSDVQRATTMLAYYEGRLEEAARGSWMGAQRALADGRLRNYAAALHTTADLTLRLGRLDEAAAHLDGAEASIRAHGLVALERTQHVLRAFIAVMHGETAGLNEIERLVADMRADGETWPSLEGQLMLALGHSLAGDDVRARTELLELVERATAASQLRLAAEARDALDALDAGGAPWFRGGVRPSK